MIGSTKQQMDLFGARVVKLARINLGASKMIDGKKRVTNSTGDLSKSLSYRVKQKRTASGQFSSGFDVEFLSSEIYAPFIEQGVKGSESVKQSAKNSPFQFKGRNIPQLAMMKWIEKKPIKLRDMGTGQFSKNTKTAKKTLAFLLGRSIATKGIAARHYYKDAIEMAIPKDGTDVALAMANDYIKQIIKEIKLN